MILLIAFSCELQLTLPVPRITSTIRVIESLKTATTLAVQTIGDDSQKIVRYRNLEQKEATYGCE